MHHGGGADGTGGTQRVAQGNGTAHGVDLVRVQSQRVDDSQGLRCKGFVQFKPVDVVQLQAGVAQGSRDGFNRANAHQVRWYTTACVAYKLGQRCKAKTFYRRLAGQDQSPGTV